jgi:hypothetical protein
MIIKPTGGLCNYLRVVFSYYYYALSIETELHVIWNVTEACNGFFLDYFEEVPNIHFYKSIQELESIQKPIKIDYSGCDAHLDFHHNLNIYDKLILKSYLKDEIKKRMNILENDYISVHIRRTDHLRMMKNRSMKNTKDEDFIAYLNNFDKNIYIATDNKETYDIFKKKYNERIKLKYHEETESLRRTSLKDAIIDMYMCINSDNFMGSYYSSFSEFINKQREYKFKN